MLSKVLLERKSSLTYRRASRSRGPLNTRCSRQALYRESEWLEKNPEKLPGTNWCWREKRVAVWEDFGLISIVGFQAERKRNEKGKKCEAKIAND